jgi:hypothetical protein
MAEDGFSALKKKILFFPVQQMGEPFKVRVT